MHLLRLLALPLFVLSLAACGDDGGGNGNGNGNGGGDGGGNGGGDGGGDDVFDDGGLPAEACRRLDIVFSIDPSGSMTEELDAMSTDIFPAFADALRNVGGGVDDYRVGVIEGCPTPANFHTRGEGTSDCGFESGEVWMTSASSKLDDEFACVGDIYKQNQCTGDNDDEQPIAAAVASLTSGENPGFLRDDGLLVVVALTDEDECPDHANGCDDTSDARAAELYDDLVAIKGDVRRMVFLGIGGGPGGCDQGAYGGADESVLLNRVADRFIAADRGVKWDLCEGQLEDGLTEAIAVIDQACRDLPPIE